MRFKRTEEAELLRLKDFKYVLKPLKKPRQLVNYIDVGFDTEFTAEDDSNQHELLSLQFSLGRGRSAIYHVNRAGGITAHELLDYVLKFLESQGVSEVSDHIYLIAFFASAEISCIRDFYEEYDAREKQPDGMFRTVKQRPRMAEYHKAMSWSRKFDLEDGRTLTLHIADLYGQAKGKLGTVGSSIGFEKLELNEDCHDDKYWKEHMKLLQDKHREVFEEYAVRDAEIAIEAWQHLIEVYKPKHLDPHIYTTYTSITIADYRTRMTKNPVPVRTEITLKSQKMPDGTWRKPTVSKRLVFDGSLDARYLALLSYWGGRNEAFARGYFKNVKTSSYDFKSLYNISAIKQPLSNEDTVYKQLTLEDVATHEGFCEVEFEFPPETNKPTLPVMENYFTKLMFPLKGVSYCTLVELRFALTLNVKVRKFRGYGFLPTENEIDNPLRDFMLQMLKHKSELEASGQKGGFDYTIEKSKMVGVVGRFAYMKPPSTADSISRMIRFSGLKNEEFRKYGRKKVMRSLYTRSEVGSSWWIEGASLIIGRARSYAGWAVNQGTCLLLSTDGGLWLDDPKLDESWLSLELAKDYSGIRHEDAKTPIDEVWIARNRCYSAWSKGKLVKAAQGSTSMTGESELGNKEVEFASLIRECLNEGRSLKTEQEVKLLTGLNQFIRDGVPLNSKVKIVKHWTWNYDGKRILDNPEVDIWHMNTWTKPYETVMNAFKTAHPAGISGRPKGRNLNVDTIEAILAEPKSMNHKAVAARYGVSESTIKRILKEGQ